jgi:hypothetical protein
LFRPAPTFRARTGGSSSAPDCSRSSEPPRPELVAARVRVPGVPRGVGESAVFATQSVGSFDRVALGHGLVFVDERHGARVVTRCRVSRPAQHAFRAPRSRFASGLKGPRQRSRSRFSALLRTPSGLRTSSGQVIRIHTLKRNSTASRRETTSATNAALISSWAGPSAVAGSRQRLLSYHQTGPPTISGGSHS